MDCVCSLKNKYLRASGQTSVISDHGWDACSLPWVDLGVSVDCNATRLVWIKKWWQANLSPDYAANCLLTSSSLIRPSRETRSYELLLLLGLCYWLTDADWTEALSSRCLRRGRRKERSWIMAHRETWAYVAVCRGKHCHCHCPWWARQKTQTSVGQLSIKLQFSPFILSKEIISRNS